MTKVVCVSIAMHFLFFVCLTYTAVTWLTWLMQLQGTSAHVHNNVTKIHHLLLIIYTYEYISPGRGDDGWVQQSRVAPTLLNIQSTTPEDQVTSFSQHTPLHTQKSSCSMQRHESFLSACALLAGCRGHICFVALTWENLSIAPTLSVTLAFITGAQWSTSPFRSNN